MFDIRMFIIGWACIIGMVVYTLLVGLRELYLKCGKASQGLR